MSQFRADIPELKRGFFWFEHRTPSLWYRNGVPTLSIRRRTLFGSKRVVSYAMPELIRNPDDNLVRERAMHVLGKVIGL